MTYDNSTVWIKFAEMERFMTDVFKAIGVPACRCVAVVESAVACNAALEAGLRCVVAPDEFTAYQDFGGADQVVEDLKDVHAKDLQALLHSCAFR